MDKSSMRLTQIFINPKNDDAPSEIALSSAHPTTSKLRKKVPLATDTGLATSRHPGAVSPGGLLKTWPGSPWERYRKVLKWHDLGGDVLLAVSSKERVNIRVFSEQQAEKSLFWFRQIRHSSFVTALEAFTTNKLLYIVLEEMKITLSHVITCSKYPDRQELGAILGQILDGVVYLEKEGIEHALGWNNVLFNLSGEAKITNQECCQTATRESRSRTVSRIAHITMGLMNKDDKPVGVQRSQWLSCPEAIAFAAATTSARSATELLEHPFLTMYGREETDWDKGSLLGLISLADTEADREYHYEE
ncbi:kinase-like protein [Diplogelasinospora grovesii]|uniref:Kinase-like protein n=1 Tax=Diplogelasinospora grovesii TaxID=303347 RepID=A0AAN6MWI5_9PEZI|nr:kinase-like protein [Diplogelasinospora grovesii]